MHGLERKPTARRGIEGKGEQGFAGAVQAYTDDDPRYGTIRGVHGRRTRRFRMPTPSDQNDRPLGPADDVETDITEHIALPRCQSPGPEHEHPRLARR